MNKVVAHCCRENKKKSVAKIIRQNASSFQPPQKTSAFFSPHVIILYNLASANSSIIATSLRKNIYFDTRVDTAKLSA